MAFALGADFLTDSMRERYEMWEVLDALLEPFYGPALYAVGWPIMKVLTLGRYPRPGLSRSYCMEAQWVRGAGVALLVLLGAAALGLFSG